MYAFIDRPVESLDNNGRFLLWARRGWTHAAARGVCAPQALHRGFAEMHALVALPDFHVAMALLDGDAVQPIAMAPMGCRRIGENEAILLGLWRGMALGRRDAVRSTLALIVARDAVAPIAHAMHAASAGLADAGFDLSSLTHSPSSRNHQESR